MKGGEYRIFIRVSPAPLLDYRFGCRSSALLHQLKPAWGAVTVPRAHRQCGTPMILCFPARNRDHPGSFLTSGLVLHRSDPLSALWFPDGKDRNGKKGKTNYSGALDLGSTSVNRVPVSGVTRDGNIPLNFSAICFATGRLRPINPDFLKSFDSLPT